MLDFLASSYFLFPDQRRGQFLEKPLSISVQYYSSQLTNMTGMEGSLYSSSTRLSGEMVVWHLPWVSVQYNYFWLLARSCDSLQVIPKIEKALYSITQRLPMSRTQSTLSLTRFDTRLYGKLKATRSFVFSTAIITCGSTQLVHAIWLTPTC